MPPRLLTNAMQMSHVYPQKQETYRYFKGDADLPPRIIVLDGSGSITFDVLTWLNEQRLPLVKVDWTGNAITVISGDSFAANRHRAAWQAETRSDPRKRMEFCNTLIAKKIEGCVLTLEKSLRRSDTWEKAMQRAYADLSRLELDPPKDVGALRTLEANSAATYFRAWRSSPLRWRESSRHPIPEDWRSVGSRTSRFNLAGNRNTSHPVNAILNYGYAVLQSQVQIKAVVDGYDPMLGIMHYERDGSPAFVSRVPVDDARSAADRSAKPCARGLSGRPGAASGNRAPGPRLSWLISGPGRRHRATGPHRLIATFASTGSMTRVSRSATSWAGLSYR